MDINLNPGYVLIATVSNGYCMDIKYNHGYRTDISSDCMDIAWILIEIMDIV
jgi:hypothetical protein